VSVCLSVCRCNSNANKSPVSRHAYTLHVVEGGKGVVYPKEAWLQTETKFNGVYDVARKLYGPDAGTPRL
jgi:hypothetical protein